MSLERKTGVLTAQVFKVPQETESHAKGRGELHQLELPVIRRLPGSSCKKAQPKLASA